MVPAVDGMTQFKQRPGRPSSLIFCNTILSSPRREFFQPPAVAHLTLLVFLAAFFLVIVPDRAWPDAGGNPSPRRVISLSPGITEILFAIGAGNQVVGATDFCLYPEAAKQVPRVGGLLNPSYETMITLQPDLIIHQKDSRKIEQFAEQLGVQSLPVWMLDMEGIYDTIQKIGIAVNRRETADRLVREMKDELEGYQNRLAGVDRKSVLLLLADSNDPLRDLYAVGRKTFLGKLLELAGGENVLPDSMAQYPKVTKEFIIRQSPELIIEAGPKANLSEQDIQKRNDHWRSFPTIRAVKTKNIHFIGADYILIPGPRLINIVGHFARVIHPDLFPEGGESLKHAEATLP